MKRNPRKLAWTKAFRKSAGKEMLVDSTLTFAARRNVPVRYNRDLVAKTLKAMERVGEIRNKRERVFYKNRMRGNKERQRELDRKLVAENSHLLPRIRGSEKKALEEAGEEEPVLMEKEKAKVFGKMKIRRKALADGGEEDEMDVDWENTWLHYTRTNEHTYMACLWLDWRFGIHLKGVLANAFCTDSMQNLSL